MITWVVRRVAPEDRTEWERLYLGYCAFYEREVTRAQLDTLWTWIQERRLVSFVACSAQDPGELAGLAHVREFIRPVAGVVAGFLDDLYVDPVHRGTGVVQSLLDAVRDHASAEGWERVRWITAESNGRARAVYDRVATRTAWVTYDMTDIDAEMRA